MPMFDLHSIQRRDVLRFTLAPEFGRTFRQFPWVLGLFAFIFARSIDPALGLNLPGAALWLAGFLLLLAFLFATWQLGKARK